MIAIAAIFDTTYESVTRIRRRMVKIERTGIDDRKKPGRRPLQDQSEADIAQFIRETLAIYPEYNQKTIGTCILEHFGVQFHQSTISRLMKTNAIPHKQSNRWYKKSKLVSTHPEGKIAPLPERNVAFGTPDGQVEYRSPYSSSLPAAGGMGQLPGTAPGNRDYSGGS